MVFGVLGTGPTPAVFAVSKSEGLALPLNWSGGPGSFATPQPKVSTMVRNLKPW